MPEITFDHYYRYDELANLLKDFAEEYPQLVQVQSIGKSYEERDIWVATITNSETGPASEKPAFWVDGNIHASEVSPASAAMYLINRLTSEYGKDANITRCLDTRAFYVCPRVNPDGAEWALADVPKIIRSSTRPYPFDEEPLPGFEREDIDGDGRMLQMRIADPNGPWKTHPDEPRLLVRRDPTETDGEYYRVLPEGKVEDYDGVTITAKRIKEGLDLNRNFPMSWRQEHEQKGAGIYPTSEPEVHAVVDFVARHENITGGVAFHTWSGVLLRPYGSQPDDKFPAEDLWTFQKIGEKGTEITGYPNVSVYHDFRYHPNEVITGDFDEWAYDHMGIFSWTVEIWSPQRQAGIEEYKFIDWFREHPVEDDLKLLKWSDDELDGQGYVDWYEFDHPQLGKIELGGWNMQYAWRNPPPQFLEKEIAPFSDWLIWHLMISPRLEIYDVKNSALGGNSYHIQMVVHNTGWLPSYVTKKALEKKAVMRGVICEIELPEGAILKAGKSRQDIGQLEGRAYTPSAISVWGGDTSTADRAKVEWVVYAPDGGEVMLMARHGRAGTVRTTVTLE
jgi:murein tripeptide amidase MpaA